MKRTGLGRDPLKWIQTTPSEKRDTGKELESKTITTKIDKGSVPKFKTFEVRLTSLLREDQLEFLDRLTRDIQKNRAPEYRKERITKNTLIRVFIDAFRDVKIDTRNIPDEETLLIKVKEHLK